MATITVTVGSLTVDTSIPDDRLINILEMAYEPDPTWAARRRLTHCLDAMWEATREIARQKRTTALRRAADQQAEQETSQ